MSWADGPFRVARYDGFKVLSPKAGKYNNQVWQLKGRDDGTFDVRNVCDGSYMSMTSPISTSVAKPANE